MTTALPLELGSGAEAPAAPSPPLHVAEAVAPAPVSAPAAEPASPPVPVPAPAVEHVPLPEDVPGERARARLERHRLRRQRLVALLCLPACLVAALVLLASTSGATRSRNTIAVRRTAVGAVDPSTVRVELVLPRGESSAPGLTAKLGPSRVWVASSLDRRATGVAAPGSTEIVYYDPGMDAAARWVRSTLGVGTLVLRAGAAVPADVTVIVGKDLRTG